MMPDWNAETYDVLVIAKVKDGSGIVSEYAYSCEVSRHVFRDCDDTMIKAMVGGHAKDAIERTSGQSVIDGSMTAYLIDKRMGYPQRKPLYQSLG